MSHDVTVQVTHLPAVSYAMAHNRVPAVSEVRLATSGQGADAAVVRLAIHDAHGSLTRPYERLVDLPAGGVVVLSDLELQLDPARMLQVEEQRPGTVVVDVVSAAGQVLGSSTDDLSVLAASQWLRTPGLIGLEILAAFVQPNSPAVAALVSEASDLLEQRTGSGSTAGYQDGPQRVDAVAHAVFDAIAARGVRYSEPPASWSDTGQKVRGPADVLDGRVGTCLDTVTTFAACLEAVGINSVLWLVEGHAFLGYWRDELALPSVAQTEVADVVNLVDLGAMRLVETTLVTTAQPSFDTAHSAPYQRWLTGEVDEVLGVVDVRRARQGGAILPLPARVRDEDGSVTVVEYRPVEHARPWTAQGAPAEPSLPGARRAVPPRVQQWKNALLDLSLRNRLVNYSARSGVALTVPPGRLAQLEDVVSGGRRLTLLPADQVDDIHRARGVERAADLPAASLDELLSTKSAVHVDLLATAYVTRLRTLAYSAKTAVEETGSNNLYLALGSLVWQHDDKPLRSPLVLVPVRLVPRNRSGTYVLEVDEAGASTPNFCLLEKLRVVHGLSVPGLAEPASDGSGIDLQAALRAMREALAVAELPYRVEETADLAMLQFAKFRLWKDIDEHWETMLTNPLVRHLVESPVDAFVDPVAAQDDPSVDLDELGARVPMPADASQLRAVADAVSGRTFVLEGPPGTGKSQTITNLLAEAVRQGRRVLFVAEKRAALDVVRRRLEQVGLGPLALDLHDKASRPATIRAQIAKAAEYAPTVDGQGLSVAREDLRTSRSHLTRYAHRLHEPNAAGLSLYGAVTAGLALDAVPVALPVPASVVTGSPEVVGACRRALETLPDTADVAAPRPEHPWGFLGPTGGRGVDVDALRSAALDVDRALQLLPSGSAAGRAVEAARTVDDVRAVAEVLASGFDPGLLDTAATRAWRGAASEAVADAEALAASDPDVLATFLPDVLALDLAALVRDTGEADAAFFVWRGRRQRAAAEPLRDVVRDGARFDPGTATRAATAALALRAQVDGLVQRLAAVPGLARPTGWNPFRDDQVADLRDEHDLLVRASDVLSPPTDSALAGQLRAALRDPVPATTVDAVEDVARAFGRLTDVAALDDGLVASWAGESLVGRWRATAAARGLDDPAMLGARRWLAFVADLEPLAEAGMTDAVRLLLRGEVAAADAVLALDLGIAETSVRERSSGTGLDAFDPLQHDRMVLRFGRSSAAVRAQMSTAVAADVVRARQVDASGQLGQIGALRREIGRQRGGLRVRQLLHTYGDVITRLMPCVLVSPDSLARFLPVTAGLFDVVVFDEASQIRVADAVGAMGRARSVVVVGDSRQMPPTSFAEASTGLDDGGDRDVDAMVVEDEESILSECVQAQVPRQWLTWHYRSQDETLIAFSNQRYYDDRLSSFPTPRRPEPDPGVGGHGISLVRVPGTFHRSSSTGPLRTNPVEAQAIVDDIRRRFAAAEPGTTPSVGVVTFNLQQRALVEGLLRDTGDDRIVDSLERTDGEGLFVKNLENVQGDERDAVLFSTAFSVNARGALPLNFGPLNNAGGERRLNVAITRARRQVVVYSSFAPEQLRAEETTSVGVKHLRAYLDLAAGGVSRLASGGTRRPVVDRHRDRLAERLRERGLVVRTDLGLSDFRVELSLADPGTPDDPRVAVLLDGPGWAARRTASDRDALPVDVLHGLLGWPAVERVWLGAWLREPDAVLDRLEGVVRTPVPAEVVPGAPAPTDALPATIAPAAAEVLPGPGPGLPGELPFRPWVSDVLGPRSVLDGLPGRASSGRVLAAVEAAVAAEGPVQLDRLVRLVAAAFGLTRVNPARTASILAVVPDRLVPDAGEPFAWPVGLDPATWMAFRSASGVARPVETVCRRELGNAMVALCTRSAGMTREELYRATLDLLGGRRVTDPVREVLARALAAAVEGGRLVERSGLVVVPEP